MQERFFHELVNGGVVADNLLVNELSAVVDQYPFCQTAHILLVKAMQQNGHIAFSKALQTAAIYVGDRTRLKQHSLEARNELMARVESRDAFQVEKESLRTLLAQPTQSSEVTGEKEQRDRLLALIRSRLKEIQSAKKDQSLAVKSHATPVENSASESFKTDNRSLIDDFIRQQPSMKRGSELESLPDIDEETFSEESEDIVSEVLAEIYLKQGHIERARNTFEKLILKYPEKSGYFAVRIKELEK